MHGKCYVCQQVTPRGRHLTRVAVTEAAAAAARAANEEARRASKSASSDLYAAAPLEIKPLYNLLEREEREDIEAVRLSTRYGAKLQLLVQHVLHISQTQTATKLIVFSSFSRGLAFLFHCRPCSLTQFSGTDLHPFKQITQRPDAVFRHRLARHRSRSSHSLKQKRPHMLIFTSSLYAQRPSAIESCTAHAPKP